MKNVLVAFETWEEGLLEDAMRGQKLVGYQEIHCHMIFDINMDRPFTRKARYVAGSHTTDPPPPITYSSVVFRLKITTIGIIGLGGVTSAFGFYLNSTRQVYIHRLRFSDK